ncbi:MAG: hypothetical protein IGR92_00165 [Leptolyngbyaceae cyanobacterium T60_A2020_046]|nr:hypothetical protein [Leptolyngbyaceae cyanobacterium T60_A2020_046]
MTRRKGLSPSTQVFLMILGVTILVWGLRGFALLSFLPGIILWLLLLTTVGAGVFASLQRIR